MNDFNRLVLGTAQLGMNYGIANRIGQPDYETASSIIQTAWEHGIREFDTAQAYGQSERILGEVLRSLGLADGVKIISKLHPDFDHLDEKSIKKALNRSLDVLNIQKLHCLMVHREDYLSLWDRGLGKILSGFMKSGAVEHIGVSVYSPAKAMESFKKEGISAVQIPSNILDRRFEDASVFKHAEMSGIKTYVRSVLLQGLLLMNIEDVPVHMQFSVPVLTKFESFSHDTGLSKRDLAFMYVKKAYPNAKIVFGVETVDQLLADLESWQQELSSDMLGRIKKEFSGVNERILNPAQWMN